MTNVKVNKLFEKDSMKLFLMVLEYLLLVLLSYTFFQVIKLKNCLGLVNTISFSLPIIIFLLSEKNKSKKLINRVIVMVLYLIIILGLPFICGKTFDLTTDGNSYHKTAIAFIKNGWNPIYEKSTDFQKNNDNVVQFDENSRIDIWIEHYPKASWIIAANYYNITNNIESGKCITIILMIMMCILAYNVFSLFLNKKYSFIISLLLALNPILLSQLFSYYIDGIMGMCFLMETLLLFLAIFCEKKSFDLWLSICSVLSIFVNLKFTGLLYSGIIAAVFYFYWIIKNKKESDFLDNFKKLTLFFTIVFSVAIFFVGSNSYVLNTIEHHNPLYPLIGKDKQDIITEMQPKVFNEISSPQKFIWSLFSKTENVIYSSGKSPELKNPFMVYKSELDGLNIPDLRIAGFGPLFALTLIISLLCFVVCLIKLIKNDKKIFVHIGLISLIMILTVIFVGEGWWARYVPQLFFIPIGVLVLIGYVYKYFNNKKFTYVLGCILGLVLIINSLFFIKVDINNLVIFKQIREDISMMQNKPNLIIQKNEDGLVGNYYNLKDNNVKYTLVDKVDDDKALYVYNWRFKIENN